MKRAATFDNTPPAAKKSMNPNNEIASLLRELNTTISNNAISEAQKDPSISPTLLAVLQRQDKILTALTKLVSVMVQQQQCQPQQRQNSSDSAEEKERLRSLVLVGLPEQQASTHPFERAERDQQEVHSVLHRLGVENKPIMCYRMGNPTLNGQRPRPIKIVMAASRFQHHCLAGWKRERQNIRTGSWSKLLLRPSLTREQLQKEYEERAAKRNRRENMNQMDELGEIAAAMNANTANFRQ